ncbi:protein phosphatase 2C, putative [Entamoeba invadens IP1]|uniref:Protein phosphatase 2C, putative n=1 Tax=Entamoeba invadens IP1 TaxID=370355 RepID=A0A0A1U3U3_ENTIV|nr:protein phosphatase 2C, putative [Entamoeba invadens IP1]ELP88888.1 protein phosphatase 2C, putative [Entamoeba invadens IP1]|eukprot:XP_004255659.1 protein phosphatase 2C, putative [Entamoeba invadens IP1]
MGESNATKTFTQFIGKQKTLFVNFSLTKKEGSLLDTLQLVSYLEDKSLPEDQQDPTSYTAVMRVFSHKDGLNSLTRILFASEVAGGFLVQFDYGGLVLDSVVKKPQMLRQKSITELKSNVYDERITSLEQRFAVMTATNTVQLLETLKSDIKSDNETTRKRVTALEEKVEKTKSVMKGSDELAGLESIQSAMTRFFSATSSTSQKVCRVVTLTPKRLELVSPITKDGVEGTCVVIIKSDSDGDVCLKVVHEDGIYVVYFESIQFNELVGVYSKILLSFVGDTCVVEIPLERDSKKFELVKTEHGGDITQSLVRAYELIGALVNIEIPCSVCVSSDVKICEKKMPERPKDDDDEDSSDDIETVVENAKSEIKETLSSEMAKELAKLKREMEDLITSKCSPSNTSSTQKEDSSPIPDITPDIQTNTKGRSRRGGNAPVSPQPVEVTSTSSPLPNARTRGRREAFYHAQQPVFNSDNQCIAVGSTLQLPDCSSTCKITQSGIVKIGVSIVPDEAIVPLNEVEVGIAQTIGKKSSMEDTCAVYETNIPFMEIIGLFDGHNGSETALELSKEMGVVLKKALRDKKKEVRDALISTFETLHAQVIEKTASGSTASIVAISKNKLYVAHVGDSPVFLIRNKKIEKTEEAGDVQKDEKKTQRVIQKVTKNHHPDLKEERERVEKDGGHCYMVGGVWRVEGVVALSRSIGDRALHPYLSCIPDIEEFETDDICEVVMTSDGVTDVMNNEDILNIINKSVNVDTAANSIRDLAFKKNSQDNITAIVVKLSKDS